MPNADAPTKGLLKYISLYSVNGLAGEGGGEVSVLKEKNEGRDRVKSVVEEACHSTPYYP